MKRTQIDDGGWFDLDTSENWGESTRWDGANHISLATGSQFDHEMLYRTHRGVWILHCWSQWQGTAESYVRIDESDAHVWLARHDPDSLAAMAPDVLAAMEV